MDSEVYILLVCRVSSVFSEYYYTEDIADTQIDAVESIKRLVSYAGRLAVLGLQVCHIIFPPYAPH